MRSDTTMYLVPKSDRLVVVFAMEFPNKTDRVIANVLLGVRVRVCTCVCVLPRSSFAFFLPRFFGDTRDILSDGVKKLLYVPRLGNRLKSYYPTSR